MKYSEFKAEVEKLGLHIYVYHKYIDVGDISDNLVGSTSKTIELSMDTEYEHFRNLPQEQRAAVFEAMYELAKTPLAEREEEKRYYLRLAATLPFEFTYLNKDVINGEYSISDDREYNGIKTIFTESEISKMDITGFQKVEVVG